MYIVPPGSFHNWTRPTESKESTWERVPEIPGTSFTFYIWFPSIDIYIYIDTEIIEWFPEIPGSSYTFLICFLGGEIIDYWDYWYRYYWVRPRDPRFNFYILDLFSGWWDHLKNPSINTEIIEWVPNIPGTYLSQKDKVTAIHESKTI